MRSQSTELPHTHTIPLKNPHTPAIIKPMFPVPKSKLSIGIAVIVIAAVITLVVVTLNPQTPNWITAQVERGDVTQTVSVSGSIEAKNTAELAFPASGKVTEVFVDEGQTVTKGEVLATLASVQLVAQRNDATAQLHAAQARYDKVVGGETVETKAVSEISLSNAKQVLTRTISEEERSVENARRIVLSTGLSALSSNPYEQATAPTVSGSYLCEQEGSYVLEVYGSASYSDYSYRFSGPEKGVASVSTDQPSALGSCGLFLQFTADDVYGNSIWTIDIPNTRSSLYTANTNALATAQEHQINAVAAAEDALALVSQQNSKVLAGARSEEIREAQAGIDQARARVTQIDAQIDDRSVVAPFDGVITDVSILPGETATLTPVITLLAANAFELKARVPEIDIIKIMTDQKVEINFDAKSQETYYGKISYISPLAVLIDGVAYFETTVSLDSLPSWIRSGLNADVNIIVGTKEGVLKIPKRFLIQNADGTKSVSIPNGTQKTTIPVTVDTVGNDGFVEVTGLTQGQVIVAP